VITVSVLFLVVNGAYLLILSPQELSASEQKTAIWAMQRSLGPAGSKAITVLLIISAFGAANGMALTGARIAFAAGRDQALFEWFARTHPRTKTPVRGLTVQACLACLAVILMDDPFDLLLFTGLAYWAFAALTGAAVIVIRQREPDRPRPFRVWLYPLTPALFILVSVGMAASVVIQTPQGALATVFVLLAGVIVFVMQLLWIRSTRPTAT
jgi:amino acid transporter